MTSSSREFRREEYSTNVIRSLQPSRPMSPYSQKSDFDSNLDYILDDLQHSISRPGSSLGQPINNFSSQREVQYLQPVNTTMELRERSLSPSSSNRIYKTAKYEYSSSSTGQNNNYIADRNGNLNEINKLDTLLNDLEKERTATLDRNTRSTFNNNAGIDSGLIEPGSKVIKSTTTYTSNSSGGRAPVSRELVFDSPDAANRSIRQLSPAYETKTIESTSSVKRNVTYNDDGLYGKPRTLPSPLPINRTISPSPRNDRYRSNEIVPLNEVVHVKSSDSSVLNEVPLPHEYLPKAGTKVTTTVRTYTYEIPDGEAGHIPFPEKNSAVLYKSERRERSGGFYPNTSTPLHPSAVNQPLAIQETPYNATTTNVYKYESNNSNSRKSASTTTGQQVPPGGITIYPPQSTTVYKTETINSANKQYHSGYPYHPRNEPSVVYKQTTTTRNVMHPHESEPLIHPFPVERPNHGNEVDGPPKRVEDLMATFGDTSEIHYTNKRVQIAEKPLTPNNNLSMTTTKVYSSETDNGQKQVPSNSKNITGPPVYYPPNHELFEANKEESMAVQRAQGGYARASGKYMYESESKSKSSSKSGAAVVPLCCPLCCAMPCTIM